MRVLYLDIETSPLELYNWSLFSKAYTPDYIIDPTRVICWAAKWEDSDEAFFGSEWQMDHKDMIVAIYDLVNEADAIVTYNGQSFDMKHLNREFLIYGLPPPEPYKNIDLYHVVRRNFRFPSNKLDYVCQVLLGEGKTSHSGMQLWIDCLNGDKAAQAVMEEYNIQDVVILERLYGELQGWIKGHPNRALWIEDQSNPICPNCGSTHVVKKGIERPARVNAYQRYKCRDCGANSRGRQVIASPGEGVLV